MLKTKLLACLLVIPLSGCSGIGRETKTVVIDSGCYWTKPIRISRADILTEATAEQILAHNETGAKRCGWERAAPKTTP